MRSKATNEFEKDFFKLANNAVFGKQMENVRKRFKPLKFVTSREQFLKECRKPCYVGNCLKYSESMISLCHAQTDIVLNKPIQIGLAVQDLSKLRMFQFHYETMLPFYGAERLRLLFTDTDSLCYRITTLDVYQDLKDTKLNREFDFSNYPKEHPLFDESRKKVAGFFKDESAGVPLVEFVGLRAKMYSVRTAHAEEIMSAKQEVKAACFADDTFADDNFASELFNACIRRSLHRALRRDWKENGYDAAGKKEVAFMNPNTGERTMRIQDACEKKVVKGVKRMVAKVELRHQHFLECLLENRPAPRVFIPRLGSKSHQIYMLDQQKVTLNAFDDKRHILSNGIRTLAHGHWRIAKGEQASVDDDLLDTSGNTKKKRAM